MATQKEIAEHIDLTDRRVRKLIASGVLPSTNGKGTYDLDVYRLAYIRYLRGVASGQVQASYESDEDGDDFSRKLEFEKYREKKRQNDIEEKTVVPVELLVDAIETAANQVMPVLESLPLIIKRNWPEVTGDQTILIKKSVAECCNTIAGMKLEIHY